MDYGKAAEGNKLTVFRLWNSGGEDKQNGLLLQRLEEVFPKPWKDGRKGTQLAPKVYLEPGEKFDWPDLNAPEGSDRVFCYGMRDQIGVLCDGTVVPCCLDHDGDLALGNLLTQEMEDILSTPRAKAIFDGFSNRQAAEELCRKCGYARRFG
jgi:radical SAM protein with 4Fe4S-binding SPASM domain